MGGAGEAGAQQAGTEQDGAVEVDAAGSVDVRLILLTVLAAATDAVSYLGLGRVFPANMTGNTVLLGIGLAQGEWARAGRSATALAAFLVGALVAGVAGRTRRGTVLGLGAEAVVLAAAAVGWVGSGTATPGGGVRYLLVAGVSVAMGLQSATVARLDVGVSTTYITGTWTAVAARVGGRGNDTARGTRLRLAVVTSYLGAACCAALVFHAV